MQRIPTRPKHNSFGSLVPLIVIANLFFSCVNKRTGREERNSIHLTLLNFSFCHNGRGRDRITNEWLDKYYVLTLKVYVTIGYYYFGGENKEADVHAKSKK